MVACDVCGKNATKEITCDHCKTSRYCSSDCKVLGTTKHRACMPLGRLRSIDYLFIDVYDNQFPTNEKTIRDYGFVNCKSQEEWIMLFGLYIGVLKFLGVPRDVLHEYCMKDQIADVIKQHYENYPVNARGEYYPWFLQHQHIVKNGNKIEKSLTNFQATAKNSKSKEKPSAKYSIQDGAHIINYGYNGERACYYLIVQDPRLAWRSGLTDAVEKLTNDIDSTGEGILLQLQTCPSPTNRGHHISVDTLAEFYKRYGIRNSHIEKMKQGKSF